MICRTLRPRSAWSCEINMFWDTGQAITLTTRAGAKSRSSCAHPRASRPLPFTPRPATTRRRTELRHYARFAVLGIPRVFLLSLLLFAGPLRAQIPVQTPPPPPPPDRTPANRKAAAKSRSMSTWSCSIPPSSTIAAKFVEGLGQDNFRVYEDKRRAEALPLQARRYSRQHGPGH